MKKQLKPASLINSMSEGMIKQFHELKTIELKQTSKHSDVERWTERFLTTCLGYTTSKGYFVQKMEEHYEAGPDFMVFEGKTPLFVVELKKLGCNLNKYDYRYQELPVKTLMKTVGFVPYAFLTNGYEWRLYDLSNPNFVQEIYSCDMRNEVHEFEFDKKFVQHMCDDFFHFHAAHYAAKGWLSTSRRDFFHYPEFMTKTRVGHYVMNYAYKINAEGSYNHWEQFYKKYSRFMGKKLSQYKHQWEKRKSMKAAAIQEKNVTKVEFPRKSHDAA